MAVQTDEVETTIQEKAAKTAAVEVTGVETKRRGKRPSEPAKPLTVPLATWAKKVRRE